MTSTHKDAVSLVDPMDPSAAALAIAGAPPVGIVLVAPCPRQGKQVGEHLAAYWHAELIEPEQLIADSIQDTKKTKAAQARAEREREQEEGGEEEKSDELDLDAGDEEEDGEQEGMEEDDEDVDPIALLYKFKPRPAELASDIAIRVSETITNGGLVSSAQMIELMEARANSDRVGFRGYVLVCSSTTELTQLTQLLNSVESWRVAPTVVCHLQQPTVDTIKAIESTTQSKSGAVQSISFYQHEPPPAPSADSTAGQGDEEEDEEEEEMFDSEGESDEEGPADENAAFVPQSRAMPRPGGMNGEAEGDEGEDGYDEGEEEEGEEGGGAAAGLVTSFRTQEAMNVSVPNFSQLTSLINKLCEETGAHLLQTSAQVEPHMIVNSVTGYLEAESHAPALEPVLLNVEQSDFSSDAEMFDTLCRTNLGSADGDDIATRTWTPGPYGVYCPVSLLEQGALVRGDVQCAVAAGGCVYVCADAAARKRFAIAPTKYMRSLSHVPRRIVVAGFEEQDTLHVASLLTNGEGDGDEPVGIYQLEDLMAVTAAAAEAAAEAEKDMADKAKAQEEKQKKADEGAQQEGGDVDETQGSGDGQGDMAVLTEADETLSNLPGIEILQNKTSWVVVCKVSNITQHLVPLLGTSSAPHVVVVMHPPPAKPLPTIFVGQHTDDTPRQSMSVDVEQDPEHISVPAPESTNATLHHDTLVMLREKGSIVCSIPLDQTDDETKALVALRAQSIFKVTPHQVEHSLSLEEDQEITDIDWRYGNSGRYCPVSLKEAKMLIPGQPDIAISYDGMYHHFASDDARVKFQLAPYDYVSPHTPCTPPPPRLCFVGPAGGGKSLFGRRLAKQHGMVHASFKDIVAQAAADESHPQHQEAKDHIQSPSDTDFGAEPALAAIKFLWSKQGGFILEGFPRNGEDLRTMIDSQVFPEAIVRFDTEPQVTLRRTLPLALRQYGAHRQEVMEEREREAKAKAKAAEQHRKDFEEKQKQRLVEFEEKRAQAEQDGEDFDEEFEEEEYVELAADEDEDDVEHEDLETDEEATLRLTSDINALHGEVTDAATAATDAARDEFRITTFEINANTSTGTLHRSLTNKLKPLLEQRDALFETCFTPMLEDAEQFCNKGLCRRSRLQNWDAVQAMEDSAAFPTQALRFPVIYRNTLYYFASRDNRQKFISNPLKVLANMRSEFLEPSSAKLNIIIVGPPNSGKTTLAEQLSATYGLPIITIGRAIRFVLDHQPTSELGTKILSALRLGETVPPSLRDDALLAMLHSPPVHARGFILELSAFSLEQYSVLRANGLEQFVMFELVLPLAQVLARAAKRRQDLDVSTNARHDSDEIVRQRFSVYQTHIAPVRAVTLLDLQACHTIDANGSTWMQRVQAERICLGYLQKRRKYLLACKCGKPARVNAMCVSLAHVAQNLGSTKRYCPVRLKLKEEFVLTEGHVTTHTVVYNGKFYYLADEEAVDEFTRAPEKYTSVSLPKDIPSQLQEGAAKLLFPHKTAFRGFCPVSYHDGALRPEALQPGLARFCAKYKDKVFAMASRSALKKFMCSPRVYYALKEPLKVPMHPQSIDIAKLPMLGYMEQTVAHLVVKSITQAGLKRHKFPFLSSKETALTHVAMYMKAHNPKSTDFARASWRQKLRKFEEQCGMVPFLGQHAPSQPPSLSQPSVAPKLTPQSRGAPGTGSGAKEGGSGTQKQLPLNFDHSLQSFFQIGEQLAQQHASTST
eukprot:m.15185 g.15185  ORF g.15185 m.15185 type:complete len:1718 (-) comp6535_c0_seq1:195-5348(-)